MSCIIKTKKWNWLSKLKANRRTKPVSCMITTKKWNWLPENFGWWESNKMVGRLKNTKQIRKAETAENKMLNIRIWL